MDEKLTRRAWMQGTALATAAAATPSADAGFGGPPPGWVAGRLTGAAAVVKTLQAEGCECVYGIPGAQENELWDEFKRLGLPYLLVTHEFSASYMADGYARSRGKPGVVCLIPGPGITNALSGIGEALLDSVPMVCVVGDVARGEAHRPFQVHSLDNAALLKPVCKQVYAVTEVGDIPAAVRQAFRQAAAGEPGPVGVVIPYNLLLMKARVNSGPLPPLPPPFDAAAADAAVRLLACRDLRVGIYAGQGCMNHGRELAAVAELLNAPVATSVSGKGVIPETHPLAVGWGYGPHATRAAERAFAEVDCTLALGVKYAEVSTGFYGNPQTERVIHVDAEPKNIGRVMKTDVGVQSDIGVFLNHVLTHGDHVRRPADGGVIHKIAASKADERKRNHHTTAPHGVAPMQLVLALRRHMPCDSLLFVDVTVSEHLAAEAFTAVRPRSFFCPIDNQSMGYSIPAAVGAAKVNPGRAVATFTGDGCFLMSAMEISTAARERLPVKFFILDDRTFQYMQKLQKPAYRRTTATILAGLDYAALARGLGVAYMDVATPAQLDGGVCRALQYPGPLLVRVRVDYTDCDVRWVSAVRDRFVDELSAAQKARFLTRIAARELTGASELND